MSRQLIWAVAILLLVARSAMAAPSCAQVKHETTPCLTFLQLQGEVIQDPSPACCSGVKYIASQANTKADRISMCDCVKEALSSILYDPQRLPLLPNLCGVKLNLPPIDQNYNCDE
ncbi:unnamed protein product [Ilex paraguariensis]|uniref:Bifunctional inhibitor/plant lipid transfer protein/seed storage helical domain-containing protein n=1 Tax=Ilex paraguariensis TaxID=185542 RepID=A0ABC8ULS3_9AQUA